MHTYTNSIKPNAICTFMCANNHKEARLSSYSHTQSHKLCYPVITLYKCLYVCISFHFTLRSIEKEVGCRMSEPADFQHCITFDLCTQHGLQKASATRSRARTDINTPSSTLARGTCESVSARKVEHTCTLHTQSTQTRTAS